MVESGTWSPCDRSHAGELDGLLEELVRVRHDLHRHPELGFEEHRTQDVVRQWLRRYDYEPQESATTGLFADLRPDRVGRAKTIALRADLDCLPMEETTPLPHRSVHPGRAHKCGHDGHTAILMGVAARLAERRKSIDGNVRLIFQPAEEGVNGGGAKVMVAEGVLDPVDEIYGLHNWPGYPEGEIRVRSGALMAQTHTLVVELIGVGGHGSQPQLVRDPIVAAAHLVVALQTAVSRGLGYEGGAVLSIGKLHAGTTSNVIPDRAQLVGTIRTFSAAVTERVLERVREIVYGTAASFGVQANLELNPGYPVLINDDACTQTVQRVARRLYGEGAVTDADLPMAGGEDFAYFAQVRPAAYFFIGSRPSSAPAPVCHHPDFDFNDRILPRGIEMFLGIVQERLG